MSKRTPLFAKLFLIFVFSLLTACGKENTTDKTEQQVVQKASVEINSDKTVKDKEKVELKVEEIGWANLVPPDYDPNTVIDKYLEEMKELRDDDPRASVLYGNIQAELDNAPVNMLLDGKTIKMPGFIAPLENTNGVISEFLLVPYFGACIHTPPPPVNQTVMVKAKQGQGVKSEDANYPVWITGKLKAVEERTTIGAAGYRIENPVIEPYEED